MGQTSNMEHTRKRRPALGKAQNFPTILVLRKAISANACRRRNNIAGPSISGFTSL